MLVYFNIAINFDKYPFEMRLAENRCLKLYTFIMFLVFGLNSFGQKSKTIPCPPDNRMVSYPASAKDVRKLVDDNDRKLDMSAAASVDVIGKVKISVAEFKLTNDRDLLINQINNENFRLKESFKVALSGFMIDPCKGGDRFFALVDTMNNRSYNLSELSVKMAAANSGEVIERFIKNYKSEAQSYLAEIVIKELNMYYETNDDYPDSLSELKVSDIIQRIGAENINYEVLGNNRVSLTFTGKDLAKKTIDDLIYNCINGDCIIGPYRQE